MFKGAWKYGLRSRLISAVNLQIGRTPQQQGMSALRIIKTFVLSTAPPARLRQRAGFAVGTQEASINETPRINLATESVMARHQETVLRYTARQDLDGFAFGVGTPH